MRSCYHSEKGNDHPQPLLRVKVSASEIEDLTDSMNTLVYPRIGSTDLDMLCLLSLFGDTSVGLGREPDFAD
jgi:hypothetical protein